MGKVVNSNYFKQDSSENESESARNTSKNVPGAASEAAAEKKPAQQSKPAVTPKTEPKPAGTPKTEPKPAGNPKTEPKPAGNPQTEPKPAANTSRKPAMKPIGGKRISPMRINKRVMDALKQLAGVFSAFGRKKAAKEVEGIYLRGSRNLFTISVVGEFSRGKSTFINNMLGKNILPVGDLPTTAMLTRIRYAAKDTMVHVDLAGNVIEVSPTQDSWKGLTADNFGHCDPEGFVHIGMRSQWLGENSIEIIDTPGAGDLEEKRAQLIGESLLGSDGAIITISATSPLSLTEKTFIEERLLSRKTPFLMLIITKLDMIPQKERADMVDYIKNKLKSWKMDNIPVFIPNKVEIDGGKYSEIMGCDKIKAKIFEWLNDPGRVKLTEAWISAQAVSVLERELCAMKNQMELITVGDEKKRAELIEVKKANLAKTEVIWDNLCSEMEGRSAVCFKNVVVKVEEMTKTIIDRLQYEVGHTSVPEKWWKEDYPYRLKIELTNLSVGVTNVMSKTVTEDIRWLNSAFEQNFRARFITNSQEITADKIENTAINTDDLKLSNVDKQRKAVKVGSSLLTIVGASATVALKMSSLVWTMGVGTCISLVSEAMFKKELESQQEMLRKRIAEDVPKVVSESIMQTKSKIEFIYKDIINSAAEKKKEWIASQTAAIESSTSVQSKAEIDKLNKQIDTLDELLAKLTK